VTNLHDLPYVDQLKELNLPTLSYHRFRGDIIFLHRIINNGFNISFSEFFTYSPVTSTRVHNYKLFKSHASCRPRHNFFTMRVINNWNGLPSNIINSSSVNTLKKLVR